MDGSRVGRWPWHVQPVVASVISRTCGIRSWATDVDHASPVCSFADEQERGGRGAQRVHHRRIVQQRRQPHGRHGVVGCDARSVAAQHLPMISGDMPGSDGGGICAPTCPSTHSVGSVPYRSAAANSLSDQVSNVEPSRGLPVVREDSGRGLGFWVVSGRREAGWLVLLPPAHGLLTPADVLLPCSRSALVRSRSAPAEPARAPRPDDQARLAADSPISRPPLLDHQRRGGPGEEDTLPATG